MILKLPFYLFLIWNLIYSLGNFKKKSFWFVLIPFFAFLFFYVVGFFSFFLIEEVDIIEQLTFKWNRFTFIDFIFSLLELISLLCFLKQFRTKAFSFWIVWIYLLSTSSIFNYFINVLFHEQREEISWDRVYSVSPLIMLLLMLPLLLLGGVKAFYQLSSGEK